jgi:hypothetical protein
MHKGRRQGRGRFGWKGLASAGLLMGVVLAAFASPQALAANARVPSTFSATIGPALLCQDHIDPYYFWTYLNRFFGPPYKAEGGAYWFKVNASLWGVPVSDVLVSNGHDRVVFLAAATEAKPDALSRAISDRAGIRHTAETYKQYSPLRSATSSRIVYFGDNSKIYCSRYNLDYGR